MIPSLKHVRFVWRARQTMLAGESMHDRKGIVGTALAIGLAAAGAASSIAGGLISKSGADNAADATLAATREANAESKRQFDIGQKNLQPWVGAGAAAEGRLSYLLGLQPYIGDSTRSFNQNYGPMGAAPAPTTSSTVRPGSVLPTVTTGAPGVVSNGSPQNILGAPRTSDGGVAGKDRGLDARDIPDGAALRGLIAARQGTPAPTTTTTNDGQFGSLMHDFGAEDFQVDPGYLFRLQEGQKVLDRSASASGGMFSGAALKANDRYNQDFASNEYSNAYGRYQANRQTKYNFLAGLSGNGQGTAQYAAGLGADYARTVGGNTIAGANAAAQARASGYNSLAGSIATAPGTFGGVYDYARYGR